MVERKTASAKKAGAKKAGAKKAGAKKAGAKKAGATKPSAKAAAKKPSAKQPSAKPASAKKPSVELERRAFESAAAWGRWLARHHASEPGVWLEFAKRGSGIASVTYPEALEQALCWGWIDGQVRSIDEARYMQRFTPRGARSIWSKINCAKALALIESGAMQPSGLAQVEAAKADGRWDRAYDSPSKAAVPDDLAAALAAQPAAAAAFAALDATNRYAILHRLQVGAQQRRDAKIVAIVAMLLEGRTHHPPRKRST